MPTTRAASAENGSIFDQAADWLVVAATYFLVGVLFVYSGKGKLFDVGTASLYTYFASTAVIFLLALRLPPNGPRAWLSAGAARGT